jgi:predicted DNA-binding transcriptional regulator YafY
VVARKLERLVNLVLCLMSTRRFLSVAEIGAMVDGYDPGESPADQEAFRRMFERDKGDLRSLGIPLATGRWSTWEDEVGYRIPRADYVLPEITLDAAEASALALALRMWSSGGLMEASRGARLKLQAAGVPTLPPPPGVEPRLDADDPALEPALEGIRQGCAVRFDYRGAGATTAARRTVDPWGVVSWRGRWYLVGHDHDRDAARVFRLSRVRGSLRPVTALPIRVPRPPDTDLRTLVSASQRESGTATPVVLLLRAGAGNALRRRARPVPGGSAGWDRVELDAGPLPWLAAEVASLGPSAVVVSPPALAAAVAGLLAAALAAHGGDPVPVGAQETGETP